MKRLLSAALALSLLGATAAQADPYGYRRNGSHEHYQSQGYDRGYDGRYRHHGNGAGTAIAVGVGLIALTAILAANHERDRDRDYDRGRDSDRYEGPPPPRDNGFYQGEPNDQRDPYNR